MDLDSLGLTEAMDPVNSLNEVVELVIDSQKDSLVAMLLEITPAPGNGWLCEQDPVLSFCEADQLLFLQVILLRPVHARRVRENLLQVAPLIFQVVPDDEMIIVDDLRCFFHPGWQGQPLFSGSG